MARSPASTQQGGSETAAPQQQQSGKPAPTPQQQGQTPVIRDWASI